MAAARAPAPPSPPPSLAPAASGDDGTTTTPQKKAAKRPRPPPALPWMRCPLPVDGGGVPLACVTGLDARIEAWLREEGVAVGGGRWAEGRARTRGRRGPTPPSPVSSASFTTLFPVQAAVWAATAGGRGGEHDLAVASPTGSGKTLAYALPAAHALLHAAGSVGARSGAAGAPPHPLRRARGVGALIVVPTRDLAAQVAAAVAPLFAAVGLTVATVAGGGDPGAEATALTGGGGGAAGGDYSLAPPARPADAVVATPGRLAAHLARLGEGGARAALSGLRFIVVDEADRLLRQHYGGWLDALNAAAPAPGSSPRCVRVAASATLTRDPAKVARLRLFRPRYVAAVAEEGPRAGGKYVLPPGLRVARLDVRGGGAGKPAALLALLRQLSADGSPALVFCGSVATAARVAAFLAAASPPVPAALAARGIPAPARAAALASLATGTLAALVASDGAGRGLDIDLSKAPSKTSLAVVNYDPPTHAKAFVHRAGRTARAGREGVVITLVRPEDGRHYSALASAVGGSAASSSLWRLPKGALGAVREGADAAVEAVGAGGKRRGAL